MNETIKQKLEDLYMSLVYLEAKIELMKKEIIDLKEIMRIENELFKSNG